MEFSLVKTIDTFSYKMYILSVNTNARVVELVDTLVSGTRARKGVGVRVPSRAGLKKAFNIKVMLYIEGFFRFW